MSETSRDDVKERNKEREMSMLSNEILGEEGGRSQGRVWKEEEEEKERGRREDG